MTREDRKEQLRVAAIALISECKFYGEAYYLRKLLRQKHEICLSSAALRTWMQELADQGHFVRSRFSHGGQGYTWSLPEVAR